MVVDQSCGHYKFYSKKGYLRKGTSVKRSRKDLMSKSALLSLGFSDDNLEVIDLEQVDAIIDKESADEANGGAGSVPMTVISTSSYAYTA